MIGSKIGTREEWLVARDQLLEREKEHTRLGDEIARQQRELPLIRICDVEHIVVPSRDNRSFDHYFGLLRGVRGLVTASGQLAQLQIGLALVGRPQ